MRTQMTSLCEGGTVPSSKVGATDFGEVGAVQSRVHQEFFSVTYITKWEKISSQASSVVIF